jgi:PKD repeat protein
MKKIAFSTLLCLLFAVLGQAQNPVNVTGVVTRALDGSPVANQWVYCTAGDSIVTIFGEAFTGPDGTYNISLSVPPGFNEIFVATLTFCDPVTPLVSITAAIVNGQVRADFVICEDSFPNSQNCFADMYIEPLGNLTFQFTSQYYAYSDSSQAVSYVWNFGDGTTSNEANPVHTYAEAGFYFGSLTVTGDNGCSATIQYAFETTFQGFPECMGYIFYQQTSTTSFDFSAELYDVNGNVVPAISYNWDFGDGEFSSDPNPSHNYAIEGVYTVQLHAITQDSCEIHSCDVVFALDSPVDTFWYGCQAMFATGLGWPDSTWIDPNNPTGGGNPDPLTVSFFDLSLGGVISWAWNFGDSTTSTEQNPTHTYAAEGFYSVTLAITTVDGCESEITFDICIGNNCWIPELDCQALFVPIPDSLGGNGIQFLDLSIASAPIQGWLWDFGDGDISTDQNPYHVYTQPGIYPVSLSITADSCNSVITFLLDTQSPWNFNRNGEPAQLGVSSNSVATKEAVKSFDAAKLFPNPATNDISIAFNSKKAGDYELRISDQTGKVLVNSKQTATLGVNAARVNIATLVPGLYLAEIRSGESVQTIKFVKQ